MNNTNRYVTGLILTAAIVVFSGFIFLHGLMKTVAVTETEEITYNMPRPKSALYNFFFGLEGREIQRKEIDPFADKQSTTTAGAGSVRKPGDKKVDPKTASADAAKKAAAAAKIAATNAAAAAAAARKKPQVKVNVIPKTANNGISSDGAGRTETVANSPVPLVNHAGAAGDGSGANADDKANQLSSAQWRALVEGQPTKENITKLVAAFNEKKVDPATLYLIMGDLVQSSNPETQAQGLSIAQQVPSLKSFAVISENYEKLDVTVKKSADTYFMSYMQPSRLPILAVALQSQDAGVVHRAAQVMVAGLSSPQAQAGGAQGTGQGRPIRGVSVASSPKPSYAQFIPLFQQLEKNPDSSIAALAQNALSQLQAPSNT